MDLIIWNDRKLEVTSWEIKPKGYRTAYVKIITLVAVFKIHGLNEASGIYEKREDVPERDEYKLSDFKEKRGLYEVNTLPTFIKTNDVQTGSYGIEPHEDIKNEYLFWEPNAGSQEHYRAKVTGRGYEEAFKAGGRLEIEVLDNANQLEAEHSNEPMIDFKSDIGTGTFSWQHPSKGVVTASVKSDKIYDAICYLHEADGGTLTSSELRCKVNASKHWRLMDSLKSGGVGCKSLLRDIVRLAGRRYSLNIKI